MTNGKKLKKKTTTECRCQRSNKESYSKHFEILQSGNFTKNDRQIKISFQN